jgi:hypothetical protein
VARGCAEEAIAGAAARRIGLQVGDPIEHIRRLGGRIPDAWPSMLLDHLAGRRSEIDVINGAVPREAAKVGLATPVNETVVALVKAREAGFRHEVADGGTIRTSRNVRTLLSAERRSGQGRGSSPTRAWVRLTGRGYGESANDLPTVVQKTSRLRDIASRLG